MFMQEYKGGRLMRAREYMLQVRKIDRLIENRQKDIEVYMSVAEGTGSVGDTGERVKSSPHPDKMEEAVLKAIEFQEEIKEANAYLVELRHEITQTIERLSASDYDILHKIYLQNMTFKEVGYELDRNGSTIKRMHGQALKHLQAILDEREQDND